MANTENREEFPLPAKRKPDLARREPEGEGGDRSSKGLKLEALENLNHAGNNDGNARGEGNHSEKALVLEEKRADADADAGVEEEEEEEEEDDDYEDDEDGDDDDGEEEDEGDEVDVKGKGILKDDKGKGKLIVEEAEEDSGDSSGDDYGDVGIPSESDSDLSDDPLAEVDLDNILPSRTRRRSARPGVVFARDGKDGGGDDRS